MYYRSYQLTVNMDTLHKGVLEDSGMDHSEIFINVLLLSTCQLVISHTCILY